MMPKLLNTADLEQVYDRLATAIDQAGEDRTALFLSKLALALANLVGDRARVEQAIDAALKDL